MSIPLLERASGTGSFAGEQKEVHVETGERFLPDALLKLPSTTTTSSGEIVLIEVKPFAGDASQAWFWTPEWQAGETEATAQMAAGQGEFFESGEDLARAFKERRRRNGNV